MKTIRTKVYQFSELNETAQQTAVDNYRNNGIYTDYIYDDAYESVKIFHDVFNTKEGHNSWLDVRTGHIDDSILNLTGLRLQKYIWNNFKKDLFKGKYLGDANVKKCIKHKRIEAIDHKNGNFTNAYHSAITLINSCPFTGVCYDDDLLQPFYEYLDKKDFTNDNTTFEDLINDSFASLEKSIENEVYYRNSDECIKEYLEDDDSQYLSNGKLFNI
jgi:hypothetical protein